MSKLLRCNHASAMLLADRNWSRVHGWLGCDDVRGTAMWGMSLIMHQHDSHVMLMSETLSICPTFFPNALVVLFCCPVRMFWNFSRCKWGGSTWFVYGPAAKKCRLYDLKRPTSTIVCIQVSFSAAIFCELQLQLYNRAYHCVTGREHMLRVCGWSLRCVFCVNLRHTTQTSMHRTSLVYVSAQSLHAVPPRRWCRKCEVCFIWMHNDQQMNLYGKTCLLGCLHHAHGWLCGRL